MFLKAAYIIRPKLLRGVLRLFRLPHRFEASDGTPNKYGRNTCNLRVSLFSSSSETSPHNTALNHFSHVGLLWILAFNANSLARGAILKTNNGGRMCTWFLSSKRVARDPERTTYDLWAGRRPRKRR